MRLLPLGAPGSGKGTQATRLAEHFGVPHISSGELLRARTASPGSVVAPDEADRLDRGELVNDETVVSVVAEVLATDRARDGYVLEGFPRTLTQARCAETLGHEVQPTAVVLLDLPDEIARERISRRAENGRADDLDPAVTARRLQIYHEQTEPLVDLYRARGILMTVDAAQAPEDVTTSVLAALAKD